MSIREWALIVFTILAQMAVGSFVVLGVVHFFAARKVGLTEADRFSDRALLAIGPVVVLSMVVSLFHLGNPLNAYRAVANLGSSWLSREVLSSVLFAIVGGAFAIAQWRKIGSSTARTVLAWIAALIGLGLVFSMSNIYLLPTQPAWDTLATPVSFFTTALLLGVLAIGAAFVANYAYMQRKDPTCADAQCLLMRSTLRWMALASVVLLGVELVVVPFQIAYVAAGTTAGQTSVGLLFDQYGVVLVLRLALAFVGAGILGLFVYQNAMSAGREKFVSNLAYGAFALVLVAEVLGRFLFYATHVKIGL
jgi:anaerobic dimethyl sulfoxide reductase subunit C (anchor subunit)